MQRDVLPVALRGSDCLITAATGSGKTAAFLLPILERLLQSPGVRQRRQGPRGQITGGRAATKALILVPTRELAVQCHAMLQSLAQFTMITHVLVTGGFQSKDQVSSLKNQPDVVVATPGRILDHLLNAQSVHMDLLEIVVFDEADRLLELGFREECLSVLKHCSRSRQTMLLSATFTKAVKDLATDTLKAPVRISVGEANTLVATLTQEFVKLADESVREATLFALLKKTYTKSTIIFINTKKQAHRIAILCALNNLKVAEIHGNLKQSQRIEAISAFQKGEVPFLLATDVAARGLDLPSVDTVINYELPMDTARYT